MENPFEAIIERLDRIEILLKSLRKNENIPSSVTTISEVLNTNQAAEYLSIAKSTLYKHTAQREIPHYKSGKKIYFKKNELDEWVTKQKVSTKAEIEKMADEYIIRNQSRRRKF